MKLKEGEMPVKQLIVFCIVFALFGCAKSNSSSDTDSSPDTEIGSDAGADSDEIPLSTPYGDGIQMECLKESVCNGGLNLADCIYEYLMNDDGFAIDSIIDKRLYFNRLSCVEAAQDCDTLNACIRDAETAYFNNIEPEPCDGYPELRCEDDRVIWCLGDDGETAVDPTQLIFDLSEMDKVCDSAGVGAVDSPHTVCDEADYPTGDVCDGPYLKTCEQGEVLSFDCRHVDPDFVCTLKQGDQGVCTLPEVEPACEELTSDLYETAGRCNGNVAEFCVGGKFFQINCDSFGSAVCYAEDIGSVGCVTAL
jgi:hypothetical protein